MRKILSIVRRALRAIGHEIAETIRFGALAAAAAPRGRPAQTPAAGAVVGLTALDELHEEPEPPQEPESES